MHTPRKKLHVERKTWEEILAAVHKEHLVLLDVDGVLAADGDDDMDTHARACAQQLVSLTRVLLVTNTRDRTRARRFAQELGIPLVESPRRKPSARILAAIPHDEHTQFLVIGDKFFTDGLFARNIGGRAFLLKDRLVSPRDRLIITLSYWADDFFSLLFTIL